MKDQQEILESITGRKLVRFEKAIGKTVSLARRCFKHLIVGYDDGTFSVAWIDDYLDSCCGAPTSELNDHRVNFSTVTSYDMSRSGLITQDQANEFFLASEKVKKEESEAAELAEYQRLKAKFERKGDE